MNDLGLTAGPSKFWVPPKVAQEMAEKARVKYRAQLWQMFDFEDSVCREWNPVLKGIDLYIKVGKALPHAYVPGFPVRPGYYHFLRDNPDAPPTVQAITGDDGESFAVPDSGLLARLKANDLQDPRVVLAVTEAYAKRQREQEEATERLQEEITHEVHERWLAGTRAHVSMSRDVPWSQNSKGRRGRSR